ncbi:hypothetical protein JOJ86_000342 [Rhodococcus percolatus]|nr:hypothetical protein [Rhodococcus opacus]MBP2202616.1 hypothetical protein [Rhodococcus opacus]
MPNAPDNLMAYDSPSASAGLIAAMTLRLGHPGGIPGRDTPTPTSSRSIAAGERTEIPRSTPSMPQVR